MVSTFIATTAIGAACWLFLLVAFRLLQQRLVAQLQLASLLVDIDYLHTNYIAFVDEAFQGVGATPLILADMHQALFPRQELEESAELDNADHLCIVDLSHFGHSAYLTYPLDGSSNIVLVLRCHINNAEVAHLFDIDNRIGLGLNLLNNLTTLTDNGTDEVLRNLYLLNTRHEVLVILALFGNGLDNLVVCHTL